MYTFARYFHVWYFWIIIFQCFDHRYKWIWRPIIVKKQKLAPKNRHRSSICYFNLPMIYLTIFFIIKIFGKLTFTIFNDYKLIVTLIFLDNAGSSSIRFMLKKSSKPFHFVFWNLIFFKVKCFWKDWILLAFMLVPLFPIVFIYFYLSNQTFFSWTRYFNLSDRISFRIFV